jgi:hypothetical protein
VFPPKYFPPAYFAPKYFPPGGVIYAVFSAAAVIQAEQSGALDARAVVRKPTSSATTAFSIIRTENLAALSADAILNETNTASTTLDALLKEASTPFSVDAVFLSPAQANFGVEAFVGQTAPEPIDALTSIPGIDFASSVAMLAFDGTSVFLDSKDTSVFKVFEGGVEHEQNVTMVPGVQAEAQVDWLAFVSQSRAEDFTSEATAIEEETTTGFIDFAGGVKEVSDG